MRAFRLVCFAALGLLGCVAWLWSARAVALPAYGALPAFDLQDTQGGVVRHDDMLGKVHVVDFVFTSCATACPLLTAKMAQLQTEIMRDKLDVQLISISVDPERDSVAKLAAYAKDNGADPHMWRFLRGDEAQLRRVVVDGMKQEMAREPSDKPKPEMDDFTIVHGTRFVLIDADARIRGFYDANDPRSLAALRRDMTALAHGHVTEAPPLP